MDNLSFTIHILASTTALAASYALLMTILKKQVNGRWVGREVLVAFLSSALSLGFGYTLLLTGDAVETLSALLLLLGLANAFAAVVVHAMKVPKEGEYPAAFIGTTKSLGIVMFLSFTAHILLEFLALSQP